MVLGCRGGGDGDGDLVITVADTGIGIAAADLERVFEPFVQLDSSLARKYEGTGLGLALSRRWVHLHGGSLVLESGLGAGHGGQDPISQGAGSHRAGRWRRAPWQGGQTVTGSSVGRRRCATWKARLNSIDQLPLYPGCRSMEL
jgi:hypothetical protein